MITNFSIDIMFVSLEFVDMDLLTSPRIKEA